MTITDEIKEMDFPALRRFVKSKGIKVEPKDTKAILYAKLEEHTTDEAKKVTAKENVREKMKNKVKVVITKLDPEDIHAEARLFTLMNATGEYYAYVPFNQEVEIPISIAKNIEGLKYQAYKRVKTPIGYTDEAYMLPKYNVQYK